MGSPFGVGWIVLKKSALADDGAADPSRGAGDDYDGWV
jgi:hypothetical protein